MARWLLMLTAGTLLAGCTGRSGQGGQAVPTGNAEEAKMDRVQKTEDQWREELTPEQYHVMRQCGTEPPFTGRYWNEHGKGRYICAACGQMLFDSEQKYDSGSGWPSYTSPVGESAVATREDRSLGRVRTEVTCSRCGAHLGHVFDDGPPPTGKRYCINSAALKFERAK